MDKNDSKPSVKSLTSERMSPGHFLRDKTRLFTRKDYIEKKGDKTMKKKPLTRHTVPNLVRPNLRSRKTENQGKNQVCQRLRHVCELQGQIGDH